MAHGSADYGAKDAALHPKGTSLISLPSFPPGGLSFGSVSPQRYFLGQLAKLPSQRLWPNKDQFAGSELEQPQAGPEGEDQGWSS